MRLQVRHDERVVAKPAAVPRVGERGVERGLPRILPHAADAVVPAVELHHHVALDLAGLLVREDDPLRVVAPVARRGDELDAGNLPVEGVRHVLHRRAEVIPDVRPVGLRLDVVRRVIREDEAHLDRTLFVRDEVRRYRRRQHCQKVRGNRAHSGDNSELCHEVAPAAAGARICFNMFFHCRSNPHNPLSWHLRVKPLDLKRPHNCNNTIKVSTAISVA